MAPTRTLQTIVCAHAVYLISSVVSVRAVLQHISDHLWLCMVVQMIVLCFVAADNMCTGQNLRFDHTHIASTGISLLLMLECMLVSLPWSFAANLMVDQNAYTSTATRRCGADNQDCSTTG